MQLPITLSDLSVIVNSQPLCLHSGRAICLLKFLSVT